MPYAARPISFGDRWSNVSSAVVQTPPDVDVEQRWRLAAVVERRRESIEQRWLQQVLTDVGDRDITLTALRRAMPDYLVALVRALREHPMGETSGAEAWSGVAREHAVTHVQLGFDIAQLLHEFIVLRQILFDVVAEEGLSADPRHTRELANLVESAMAVAVESYVASRDFAARRMEAEHIGFITHELRNPLTTAELMASKLRAELRLTEVHERAFVLLVRSHKRIRELIEAVLQVERFDADEVEANPIDGRLASSSRYASKLHTRSPTRKASNAKWSPFRTVWSGLTRS